MSPLLSLQDVAYSQSGFLLLSGIHFSLYRGQIVGLLGVNGAGKSTTLKIVAGILRPDDGEVIRSDTTTIGYVPETPPLIPTWSVKRFLTHACALHNIASTERPHAIARVNDLCGLQAIQSKQCATLSKGNQQRVAIAQSLLHRPDILILDEPTSGLDPQQIHRFRDLLQTLKAETAIVLSSHIMQEITALCDHSIVIHEGRQVGKLDFSDRDKHLLITFSDNVSAKQFANLSAWQSGSGKQHQFLLDTDNNKNDILAYCLQNKLPIARVTGIEDLAERDFLALIGREVSHV